MGILNATPDSFFEGSRIPEVSRALHLAGQMLEEGAHILDVGGVSTRPGAPDVPEEEELRRLGPVVQALREHFPDCVLSIDTWRSGVVRVLQERFGIDMVNDISAGMFDGRMFETVREFRLPYVMMHMQGTPATMQDAPEYQNLVDDLLRFFGDRVAKLRKMGHNDILIDPGFGFGKLWNKTF
ncbi:MAG: dihydropteroate synthase [Bacteroidales bacterium]